MWNGDAELTEEKVAHPIVVVLARMDQKRLDLWPRLKSVHQRSDLHEVWTSADNADDLHNLPPEIVSNVSIVQECERHNSGY